MRERELVWARIESAAKSNPQVKLAYIIDLEFITLCYEFIKLFLKLLFFVIFVNELM